MFRTDRAFFWRALRAPARVTSRAGLAVLLVGGTVAVLEVPTSVSAAAATISIVNGNGSTTPSTLANTLLGPNATLFAPALINGAAAFTGAGDARLRSYGTFSNGTNDVGIDSGLIIAANADAASFATATKVPNVSSDRQDPALAALLATQPGFCTGSPCTHNATDLSFSIVPSGDFIKFEYSLVISETGSWNGSAWTGYVTSFPDGFGLFVNGESPANNCAVVPSSGAYLTMSTAGIVAPQGNAAANRAAALATVAPNQKFAYAAQNPNWTVQFLTVPLTCVVDVSAANTNQTPVNVRIVIADANDNVNPPAVLLKAGSIRFEATAAPQISPAWTDQTLGTIQINTAYADGVSASGDPAVTYSISAGGLPAGLSLDAATGAITGTATAAGAYDFTITVANGNLPDLVKQFTGNVAVPPVWTDNTIAAAFQVGVAVNDGVAASGTPSPTYSISAGGLPGGLSLNTNTGAITGSPTTNGAYSFTLSAGNGIGSAVTQVFSGTVTASPTWTDQTLGTIQFNVAYSDGVSAFGNPAATYSLSVGALPTGLSLDTATGAITGTPTAAGAAYDFTITATNGNAPDLVKQFTGYVAVPPAWTDNTIAAPFQVGVAVNDGVAASGTPTPTYSISAGGLPGGLTLNTTTGAITGTPTTNGAYSFTLSAGNGIGSAVTQVFSGSVTTPPVWVDQTLGAFQINVAYSDGVSASGSPAPTYSLSVGVLPTGLSLNTATGAITGTPTAAGAYDFTIRAANGSLPNVIKQFTGNVGVPPTWTDLSLGTMRVGILYADGVNASGTPAPTYSITGGLLPAGLVLNGTTGAITGTPTVAGEYDFTISAANGFLPNLSWQINGVVVEAPTWTDQTIGATQVGVAFADGVLASGTPTPTYSITAGTLPAGLALNGTTGAITGTPTVSANYSFTVRASNGVGASITHVFSGLVSISPAWTDQTIGAIQINVAYSDGVSASGNPAPTYSVSSGLLPTGLSLNTATGAITGTATVAGAYDFTISAANGSAPNVVKQFTGNVAVPPAWIDQTIAAAFQVGVVVNDGVSASGTPAPTYSVSAGTIPAGLALNTATGAITGTPTTSGNYSFTVAASNGFGSPVTHVFSGLVSISPAWIDQTLGTMRVGSVYADGVSASGNPTPTFSVIAGVLPTGLSLNTATGAVTGTPTAAGAFDFTIRAANGSLPNVVQQFTGTVVEAPTWTDQNITVPFQVGTVVNDGVSASGTPVPTYSVTAGTLPAGLALNTATGAITGTPTDSGNYTFTIAASNGIGTAVTHVFSGLVSIAPAWVDQTLGTMQVGITYTDGVSASANPAPTYSVSAGLLPLGLSLNTSTGAITGNPTTAGGSNFTITVANGSLPNLVKQFISTVVQAPTWTDQNITVPFQVGTVVNDGVTASGTPTPTYSVTAGTLPAGLALNTTTGAITGTPTDSGNYTFTVAASNGIGTPVTHVFSGLVSIAPAWTDQTLGTIQVGTAYSDGVSASGDPVATYSISAGALPAGLSLDSATGAITGTSTTAGAYDFTITVANGSLPDLVEQFTGTVVEEPTWTDDTIAAAFQMDVAVDDGVSATGTPVPTYSISAGTLPAGLALDAVTGAITGTPTVGGAYSFTLSAGNGIGIAATKVFTGTVAQPAGGFLAINPVRLLDTRDGGDKLVDHAVRHLSIAGLTGIPADATSVVLNVTATNAVRSGFITVFACDSAMPSTSNVNFLANQTVASSVSVSLDASGGVCIYSDVATDVVIDISGAYSLGDGIGRLAAVEPYRIADTREDGGRLAAGTSYAVNVAGHGMPDDATAVLLNITVDDPTSAGFVTAYPCGGDVPLASNLNFLAGQTIANSAVVRIGTNNSVCFYVSKATDLIVDVNGSYSPSSAVGFPTSAHQQRLLDTRTTGSAAAQSVQEVDLNNVTSVPANATSVTLNVTVVGPQRSGFITVYPCSSGRPLASNVNFVAGQTVANSVTVPVGANHTVCVFTTAATDLVVDLNEVYSTVS